MTRQIADQSGDCKFIAPDDFLEGTGSKTVAKMKTGTPAVTEVPVNNGGPSRTRTLDPLIKRRATDSIEQNRQQLRGGNALARSRFCALLDLGFAPIFDPLSSRPERPHPGAGFLDERSRSHDTHSLARSEVPDVMRHEEARSCADRCGKDRDVLRIGKLASSFALVCRGAMDLHRNSAEELFEERSGLRELGGQIPSYLRHGGLGKDQTKEAELAENQNRVAGSRAGQQSGNQDVSIDTNG